MDKYYFEKWETGNAYNHKLLEVVVNAPDEATAYEIAREKCGKWHDLRLIKVELTAPPPDLLDTRGGI